ncbi:MAG: diguanylate cyclase [Armatimonadetes bacterium]|nr:diguanylate cyclase [Armatimonadota bacterium]
MRTVGDLSLVGDRVDPISTVSAALRLMQERGQRVVSVVEDSQFRGIVTRDRALMAAPDAPVREIVETLVIEMPSRTPVRNAARLFVENGLDCVPIMDSGEFKGLLLANHLLIELGRSWDPMTGLSWSDRLREWGAETLELGSEVTIAFIDLNDFGAYNKRHGHIVGDRVLKAVAQALTQVIDSSADVLVRYGGDEFAIGTSRPRRELEAAIKSVATRSIQVDGVTEPVSFAVGYAGGKRTKERDKVHYASTLDNLINLASRDALTHKQSPLSIEAAEAPPVERPTESTTPASIQIEVEPTADGLRCMTSVTLHGQTALGFHEEKGEDRIGAVAKAVCRALARLRPETSMALQDAIVYRRWDGHPVAVIEVSVSQRQRSRTVKTSAHSPEGPDAALATALVDALIKGSEALGRESRILED